MFTFTKTATTDLRQADRPTSGSLEVAVTTVLCIRPPGDHRVQVWSQSGHLPAILGRVQKCLYHVTFDLDLDLEHTLDAGTFGEHPVQVWSRLSHFCRSRSDLRTKVYR